MGKRSLRSMTVCRNYWLPLLCKGSGLGDVDVAKVLCRADGWLFARLLAVSKRWHETRRDETMML